MNPLLVTIPEKKYCPDYLILSSILSSIFPPFKVCLISYYQTIALRANESSVLYLDGKQPNGTLSPYK